MEGEHALQFLIAGARAVQVGTATFIDPIAPVQVLETLEKYLERERIGVMELVGSLNLEGK